MKRLYTLLLIAMSFVTSAKEVSIATALEAGSNFLNVNVSQTFSKDFDELWLEKTFYGRNGNPVFYVFNFDEGFVIVSAQDCARPILAYSNENQFDEDNIPSEAEFYLNYLAEQIQYGVEKRLEPSGETAAEWEAVLTTGRIGERDGIIVEPLVASTWNQDYPYNIMCPEDSDGPGGHVYAGCTATAASMIMHYWRFPETGQGSHSYHPYPYPTQSVNFGATTYDWDNMPNTLSGSNDIQKEAVALLQWHAGVALESNYGPTGTGASPYDVPHVLSHYFRYSDDCYGDWYGGWWKDGRRDEWHDRCRANLDAAHPIQYGGWTPEGEGHAFICDGYDSNDMFHFNFGWSGSENGYYALDAIIASGYEFSFSTFAIFDIYPEGTRYHVRATAFPENAGNIFGVGSYEPGETCTLKVTSNKHYTFHNWTIDGEIVSNDSIFSFEVSENKRLVANFDREPVEIKLEANPQNGGVVEGAGIYPHGDTVTITAIPNSGYRFVKWKSGGAIVSTKPEYSFAASIDRTYKAYFELLDGVDENQKTELKIYPNPAGKTINIEGARGTNIVIFNALGQTVFESPYEDNEIVTVNINGFENGVYFVKVGDFVRKFVKF
ncbi:MAG: C10 family peptidase [Bacteroidales bacterium]|nr:C10 family peptidase [Bacteroidales bacterium]